MAAGRVWECLDIVAHINSRIDNNCGDDEEQRREQHIHYYITCSPHALIGWSHIAGQLHFRGKETAERAAKDYVQRTPGTCGCGMCMYWNVEDACTWHSKFMPAVMYIVCVAVHLLITLMLTLTTSVHMSTSSTHNIIRTITHVGELEFSHGGHHWRGTG